MKLSKPVLLALVSAAVPCSAIAQAPTHPATPVHHTAAAKPVACAKLFEVSPKIPALPAGLPCPKPLYTLTVEQPVKLSDVSPMESPKLRKFLGIEPNSFTLAYVDVATGDGKLAEPFKYYKVNYTLYLASTGEKLESSPEKEPFEFAYGEHQVIRGWDTGLDGMRVGGKRRLYIPFELAYGPQPHGKMPAAANLIFDIELVDATNTQPPPPAPRTPPPPPTRPTPPAPAKPAGQPEAARTSAPAATPAPAAKPATAPSPAPASTPAATPPPTKP